MKLAGSILILFAAVWTTADILHARRVKLHSLRQLSELLMQICGELEAREISLLVNIQSRPEALSNSERALGDYINRIRGRRSAAEGETDLMKILEEKRKQESKEG